MHGYANIVDAENSPLAPCLQGEKLHQHEKSRFFKVEDTVTTMQPRKKKHLTKVSSEIQIFYDPLRCSLDNLKKSIMLH